MKKLTKEQMFDFILENQVSLSIDTSKWTDKEGNPVHIKYYVAINGIAFPGYDLEDAIQRYHDNWFEVEDEDD